jgi:hypothetical protein
MRTKFYTFWGLLADPDLHRVQVPLIQRDYAQGRRDAKATLIRERFVAALYEAVAGQQPLVLDFVYGELTRGEFIPLDGQQRLTTLFLLHWYLALAEGQLPQHQPTLAKFTYETHISSREFCEALTTRPAPARAGFAHLSEAIENTAWYQPAWALDPTVAAMLTMLDALETSFGTPTGWLARLTDPARPLVGFYFLNMPETGLSDDLYLKMNARGKALTGFENWKAEFDLFLQHQYPDSSLACTFGQQLDGSWTDFFWRYRPAGIAEIDEALEYYLHYVTRLLAYQRAATGEVFGDLTPARLPFACFEQVYAQAGAVQFLVSSLDFLAAVEAAPGGLDGLLNRLLTERAEPGRVRLFGERPNLVAQCLRGQLTRQGEVLLFGLLSLAVARGGQLPDEEAARDLLRVLRNLLERQRQQNETELNTNLRASDLPGFAAVIGILTANQDSVYEQLATGVDLPLVSAQSVTYEREKAALLHAHRLPKAVLHQLEDRAVLRGDLHNLLLPDYAAHAADFAQALDELWPETNPLPMQLLIRAWLTRGDYSVTQGRWTQQGHKYFLGNNRNWYTVLASDRTKPAASLLPSLLLAYKAAAGITAEQKLNCLITDWLAAAPLERDWQYHFINYPQFTEGSSGYYAWNSDFTPRLLKSTSLRGKHINPYVRTVARRGRVAAVVWEEEAQWVNDNNPSPLWLRGIPGLPLGVAQPELYCEDPGWRLTLAAGCRPTPALLAAHGLRCANPAQDADGRQHWWLPAQDGTDRIDQAEALLIDLQQVGLLYDAVPTFGLG